MPLKNVNFITIDRKIDSRCGPITVHNMNYARQQLQGLNAPDFVLGTVTATPLVLPINKANLPLTDVFFRISW